ncbi:hypothetical protein [Neorhizobium galegae]|uniref:hypothetical protein n=1 Tax=Neorhizobium galegae TaxID=399 RepID=UPI00155E17C6
MIEFGFRRLPLRRLVRIVRPPNIRSQKAMLPLRFSFAGMTEHLGTVFRFYEMQRPGKVALQASGVRML